MVFQLHMLGWVDCDSTQHFVLEFHSSGWNRGLLRPRLTCVCVCVCVCRSMDDARDGECRAQLQRGLRLEYTCTFILCVIVFM